MRAGALAVMFAVAGACGSAAPAPPAGPPVGESHYRGGPSADGSDGQPGEAGAADFDVADADDAADRLNSARAAGDSLAVVVYANRLAALGAELPVARDELEAAVDRLTREQLERVADALDPARVPAGAVALRRALLARHAGRDDVALRLLGPLEAHPVYGARAGETADEIRRRRGADPAKVAVLLPLRGRFAPVGAELRAAIELAARADAAAKLVFIDTGGDPAGAIAAVDEAVYRHRAVALLGPVGVAESAAAASRAAELGATIALLSADADPAAEAGVFRLWTSGRQLARATADAAMDRGFDSFAVLAPRDEVGAVQAAAFADRVKERGRRVTAVASYDPSGTDLEPDMRGFLGLDPARNARLRAHLRKFDKRRDGYATYSPEVTFDALFVPDDYRRAALAVAYLPFFNVELRHAGAPDLDTLRKKHGGRIPQLVQLLGSSGWHHPGLFARGGKVVEGALFVDVWGGSPTEGYASGAAAEFAERFAAVTGREPSAAAAQAFDAAQLLLVARRRVDPRRGDPRAALRRALAAAAVRDGACGAVRVAPDGAIERDVLLLQVESGQFVVDPY